MRRLNQLIALFFIMFLSSCGICRHKPNVVVKDSISTEIREITRLVRDTAYITLPVQSEKAVVRDSSHLENDYAVSEAKIDSLGFLRHSLESKKRPLALPYDRKEVRRDSVVYIDRFREIQVPVVTEKQLSWWQQTKLRAFWVLLAMVALWASVKSVPILRKIIRIIKI